MEASPGKTIAEEFSVFMFIVKVSFVSAFCVCCFKNNEHSHFWFLGTPQNIEKKELKVTEVFSFMYQTQKAGSEAC